MATNRLGLTADQVAALQLAKLQSRGIAAERDDPFIYPPFSPQVADLPTGPEPGAISAAGGAGMFDPFSAPKPRTQAEVNAAIDAALDYHPDASHGAWINDLFGLDCYRSVVYSLDARGEEADPPPGAEEELAAFFGRILAPYGGGVEALLHVGLDSIMRRGRAAVELDLMESLDDIWDVDFVPVDRIRFARIRQGIHWSTVPCFLPNAWGISRPIPFNPLTFKHVSLGASVGNPAGKSPFLPLVEAVPAAMAMRDTTGKVLHHQGFGRIGWSIDMPALMAAAPADTVDRVGDQFVVRDWAKFLDLAQRMKNEVLADATKMYPDDIWVYLSPLVKPDAIGARHGEHTMDFKSLGEMYDTDVIVSMKGQPTVFGRSWGQALSSTGQVQWKITALSVEAMRAGPQQLVEFVANAFFMVRGIQALYRLEMEPVEKQDRGAEAVALKTKVEAHILMEQAGYESQDEAAMELTGHVAAGPPLAPPAPSPAAPVASAGAQPPRQPARAAPLSDLPLFAEGWKPDPSQGPPAGEVQLAVVDLTAEDRKQTIRRWRRIAREQGLSAWAGILEAVNTEGSLPALSRGPTAPVLPLNKWQWDPKVARYRYPPKEAGRLGRLVQPVQVRRVFERRIDYAKDVVDRETAAFLDGRVTTLAWQSSIMEEVKDSFLFARMLGSGGEESLRLSAMEETSGALRETLRFLVRFGQEVARGEAGSAQAIAARASQYAGANIREQYNQGNADASRVAGFDMEEWVVQPGASCEGCLILGAQEPVPIGTLPPIGSNQCLNNCRCSINRFKAAAQAGAFAALDLRALAVR